MKPEPIEGEPEAVTAREAIVRLLSDGELHSAEEMQKVGGRRYSARVLEIRADCRRQNLPWTVETHRFGRFRYEYCRVPTTRQDADPLMEPMSLFPEER